MQEFSSFDFVLFLFVQHVHFTYSAFTHVKLPQYKHWKMNMGIISQKGTKLDSYQFLNAHAPVFARLRMLGTWRGTFEPYPLNSKLEGEEELSTS